MIERLLLATVVTISLFLFLQLKESSLESNFLGGNFSQTSNFPKLVFTGINKY
jgi:hypothetical protein